ncbi:hypothetical protein FGO68_gene1985 [Halteria grandinella]|uniref:Uncharacterized protein n=1 Tax=Halteria grandinella TaxID=5974 RepID=A0A8J8NAT6_HALGN|nr:hypothetical protein FGO68_gene1985 [Halteria grandinella]
MALNTMRFFGGEGTLFAWIHFMISSLGSKLVLCFGISSLGRCIFLNCILPFRTYIFPQLRGISLVQVLCFLEGDSMEII